MLLAIDIGNTKIAFGFFDGGKLKNTIHIATSIHRLPDEYASILLTLLRHNNIEKEDVNEAVMCSVVPPLTTVFQDLFRRFFDVSVLTVGPGIKTGVRIRLDNPREIGGDRIVNAAAVYRLYGGPAIVIDMGTAITFDVISKEGDYLGGAIVAGMEVGAEALYARTARLPRIELVRPKEAIGKNTVSAMQSGVIFGYVGLVEGLIARLSAELDGKPRVIGTGSYAHIIANETSVIEDVDPHLTLHGMRFIYELNQQ